MADIARNVIQRILNPHLLSQTASHDEASNICLALPRRYSAASALLSRAAKSKASARVAHPVEASSSPHAAPVDPAPALVDPAPAPVDRPQHWEGVMDADAQSLSGAVPASASGPAQAGTIGPMPPSG